MTDQQDITAALDELSAQILASDTADQSEIARLGLAVENLLQQGRPMPPEIESLMTLSLEAMQKIYQQELAAPSTALEAVATALAAVRSTLAGSSDGRSKLTVGDAAELLRRAISGQPAAQVAQAQFAPVGVEPNQIVACQAQQTPALPSPMTNVSDSLHTAASTPAVEAPSESGEPKQVAPPMIDAPPVLPTDTDMDILKEYIVECLDHIVAAEAALLELEVNPENGELINTIFRAFHTIKGTSGFLGLDRIGRLAHLAESLLNRGRDGQIKIHGGYADIVLRSCDTLRTMIEALKGAQPGQALVIPSHLDDLLAQLADPESHGVSEDGDTGRMRLGDILVGQGAASREAVEQAARQTDGKMIGQALVQSGDVAAESVAKALRVQNKLDGSTSSDADSTIRLSTARLDSLINMVGELVIAQSMVAQDQTVAGAPELGRKVVHADKIVRELQDLAMSLRMVPLRATFQKMARLVRDLGHKSNKAVQYICEGEGTEIDRSMVEVLNDPLVHMIRNSVDHGIDPAEDRIKAGKDPIGKVTLRAYHAAGKVVIELQDDGRGLNKERILAKAVEKGLVPAGRELTEGEIFDLIFRPGFSTAEKVTDISGRGVGMDVVKRGIDSLRGQVEVASLPGRGTTFTLRLPLTMAISDAMLVRVGQERYLLPTISIERSFRPTAEDVSTICGKADVVQLRGQLLPMFRLHRLFDIPDAVTDPTRGLLIILENRSQRCALLVDELLGQQQVVIKSLGQSMASVPGVAGAAILGDGHVGLILDAAGIAEMATRQDTARTMAA